MHCYHIGLTEILYTLTLILAKCGFLALYWRIFNYRSLRISVLVTASIVTIWGIATLVTSFLSCIPTSGFWDKSIQFSCHVNTNKFFTATSVINMLTDGWVLSLPIPYIFKLQTSLGQKLSLSALFVLGGFMTLASVLRLVSLAQDDPRNPDETWEFAEVILWSGLEMNLAIVSVNLACLRPLYSALIKQRMIILTNSLRPPGRWKEQRAETKEQDSNGSQIESDIICRQEKTLRNTPHSTKKGLYRFASQVMQIVVSAYLIS